MSINTLIIGLGRIGMIYDHLKGNNNLIQTHAKAVSLHNDFNLVAGVDPVSKQRKIFKDKFGKIAFKNLNEVKCDCNIDLVIIATPTNTHLEIIKDTVRLIKPIMILCEKPLSYKYNDSERIYNICKFSKIKLYVNYMRRCDPGVKIIKEKIDRHSISTPVKGICWYSNGIYNNGSHFINLLEFWLGEFREKKVFNKGRFLNDFEVEPEFILFFEKGDVIFRNAYEENFSFYKLELLSPSGFLRYDNGGYDINFQNIKNDRRFLNYKILNDKKSEIVSGMNLYQYNVLDEISKDYVGKNTTICKGEEALRTERIIYLLNNDLIN